MTGKTILVATDIRVGTALYLKNSLNGRLSSTFSNSVVDYFVVTSKVLDVVFVSLYISITSVYYESTTSWMVKLLSSGWRTYKWL